MILLKPDSIYIELKGEPVKIEQYKEFSSDGDIQIIEERQVYYMTSPQLQIMASDVEAYKYAQELLDMLHGVSTVIYGGPFNISLGTLNHIPGVQRGAGSCFLSGSLTVVRPPSEELTQAAKRLIIAAKGIPVILECLRYFRLGHPSIFDMYKIFEIIQDDCNGYKNLEKCNYIDSNILDNLKTNLNHPALQGESARHARMQGSPSPERYMPIDEMQRTIITLFNNWIVSKLK